MRWRLDLTRAARDQVLSRLAEYQPTDSGRRGVYFRCRSRAGLTRAPQWEQVSKRLPPSAEKPYPGGGCRQQSRAHDPGAGTVGHLTSAVTRKLEPPRGRRAHAPRWQLAPGASTGR